MDSNLKISNTQKFNNLFKLHISKSVFIQILSVAVIAISIPLSVSLSLKNQYLNSNAKVSSSPNSPVRGVAGDLWADTILGQPDFSEGMIRDKVAYKAFNPGGTWVDKSVTPNRIYVADNGNSRILGFSSIGQCSGSKAKNSPKAIACTSDSDCPSSICIPTVGKPADIVIGQPDFTRSACNGDSGYQYYPAVPTPSANSLCGMPPIQNSPAEGGNFVSMDTDTSGNLYYPDWINNRILKYVSPFTSDKIADSVWGQDTFNGFQCNKGSQPSANSLCLGENTSGNGAFVIGVDIDSQGNLWVADTKNNRVLRFPYNSSIGEPAHTADLVLGQSDFNTKTSGGALNKLHFPAAVRVDANGNIFVADANNDRVLKYSAPLVNGMSGTLWGNGFNYPTGIEIDDINNGIWVNDTGNYKVKLWDLAGTQIIKTLNPPDPAYPNVQDARGSIGITQNGDLFVSHSINWQGVFRHKGANVDFDAWLFYPPGGRNKLSSESFAGPSGITVAGNQLIVGDEVRILFWNDLQSLVNGKPADGVIGSPDFESESYGYTRLKADKVGNLYAIHKDKVKIYSLPLTSGQLPSKVIGPTFQTLEGESVTLANGDFLEAGGLYPSADGTKLWIADDLTNRVIRLRDPNSNPKIDVILGQQNAQGTECNQGGSPSISTLCSPGAVVLDNNEDVYVSDNSLEFTGNGRLLEYNHPNFPSNNAQTIYATPADRVSLTKHIFEPAFNSLNQMVIGYNVLASAPNEKHSIDFFENVQADPSLKKSFNDFIKLPYSMAFDDQNNLYVTDLNRWKVLIFKNPMYSPQITPTPSNICTCANDIISEDYCGSQTTPVCVGRDCSCQPLPSSIPTCSMTVSNVITVGTKFNATLTNSESSNLYLRQTQVGWPDDPSLDLKTIDLSGNVFFNGTQPTSPFAKTNIIGVSLNAGQTKTQTFNFNLTIPSSGYWIINTFRNSSGSFICTKDAYLY